MYVQIEHDSYVFLFGENSKNHSVSICQALPVHLLMGSAIHI